MPHNIFAVLTILFIVSDKLMIPIRANDTTDDETSFVAIGKPKLTPC